MIHTFGFARTSALVGLLLFGCAANTSAHQTLPLDDLAKTFGWSWDTPLTSQQVGEGLHVIFGIGGNIGVSIGPQGVLVVDDQFPRLMPKIRKKIAALGGGDVDFAINTHWHFDHAEGNLALGPAGTWLVSQVNSRNMMLADHEINLVTMRYMQKAYPPEARPVITFDTSMQFFFNGERIDLLHTGPAHTTGDTAVIFRGHNAVHLGDVFNNSGYPFIDSDNGGDINGMIAFCQATLDELNADSIVIPGHGPVTDYQALADYIAMLTVVRDRISAHIATGASLDVVVASKPTADFDARYGDPANFVNRVYMSLLRARQ